MFLAFLFHLMGAFYNPKNEKKKDDNVPSSRTRRTESFTNENFFFFSFSDLKTNVRNNKKSKSAPSKVSEGGKILLKNNH